MSFRPRDFVLYLTTSVSFAGLLLAHAYHLLAHPEWTQAEALRELWPFYALFGYGLALTAMRSPSKPR